MTDRTTAAPFAIDVRYGGGLTDAQRAAFDEAARRWSQIVVGDLPSLRVRDEVVDDVVIEADGVAIDGTGKVLGQAGPTVLRPGSFLPAWGVMSFDSADLAGMEADGSLVRVIVHEMGHVLGIGTIWDRFDLRQGVGGPDPRFTGERARREYAALRGTRVLDPVPLADQGGPGTRDSHWRESVFGNELMTGLLDAGANPLSRVTIAALEDVGYQVDYGAADPYELPGTRELAELGAGEPHEDHGGHGIVYFPQQTVASEDDLL